MKRKKNNLSAACAVLWSVVLLHGAMFASPSVAIDKVVRRCPYSDRLDITYTVKDGQDVAKGLFRRLVFSASIAGKIYAIDGVHTLGASAASGTHTVGWMPPPGIKATDCRMTAELFTADSPSGDDYLVIDLASGRLSYEGLLATQALSNERYNTPLYKTAKMVLRKIPAGGPYPTGHAAGGRKPAVWKTDRAYYLSIFPVTQAQYETMTGRNPSRFNGRDYPAFSKDGIENVPAHRPVECVSWDDLRGAKAQAASRLEADVRGTFLERLIARTGLSGLDLPTEVMWEIAARAGTTAKYFWGSDSAALAERYMTCGENALNLNGKPQTWPVGVRLPNAWGFYDVSGNVVEFCRDGIGNKTNTSDPSVYATDPWTPAPLARYAAGSELDASALGKGGAYYSRPKDNRTYFVSSVMYLPRTQVTDYRGFRVAYIAR
jgi:formylglycine-generating enzyme required for sulfatase activity